MPNPTHASTPTASRRHRLLAFFAERPTLAAACIFLILSIIFVGQGFLPGRTLSASNSLYGQVPWLLQRPAGVNGLGSNFELADSVQVFQPFLQFTRGVLPHIPTWNPHISAGRPFEADGQSAIFSPFSWPAYVLPFWKSLAYIAVFKLTIAALGTYVLARRLEMRFAGAVLAGIVFAFGTFFTVWIAWPLTNIFPVVPWLLVATDALVRRPGLLPSAVVATLVGLVFFGGHPETTFHALFVTVVFFLFRLLLRARREGLPRRALLAPAGAFAGGLAGGVALAAVMWIPFAELLFHSGDLARRGSQTPGYWPRKYIGALFLHDYWGRATQNSAIAPFMQVRSWYAGALTLLLVPVAFVRTRSAERIGAAVLAVFTVMMVLGIKPVFSIVTKLPGFSTAHNERMLIYFLLSLALLAGWGLDELAARRTWAIRPKRFVLACAGGIFLIPFVWMTAKGTLTGTGLGTALKTAWGFSDPPGVIVGDVGSVGAGIVRMSALLQWIPLAGLGVLLIAWRLRDRRALAPATFVALAALLLVVDLFRANMGFNPSIPISQAHMKAVGGVRYLQAQRPNRFVGVSGDISFQPLPADVGMDFGLYDARGYDYPAEKRYDTLWRRNVAPGVPDFAQPIELATSTPASLRALELLSVTDIMLHPKSRPIPGLKLAYRGPDSVVYHDARALPRVFVAGTQQTVGSAHAALIASTAKGFDGRNVVVTEHRLPGLPAGTRGAATGTARLTSYENERVGIDATARRPGLLVLTDVAFPGWKATVDGRDVPIHRVDYLLRGVELPAGHHRVEFSYVPASFRAGWIISLVTLLGLIVAAGLGVRRRRWRDPPPTGA